MSRSVWKGPFVDAYVLKKAESAKESGRHDVIKIWSRRSTILPQFVGLTFGVYNGKKHIPVNVTEEMIGQKWEALNDQLIRIMHRWEKSPRTLFYNQNLLELTEDNLRVTVRNNLHIISSITQLVHSTNYPFTHDKVAQLKQQVSNITELLQIWMNVDKKRQSTAFALNEILWEIQNNVRNQHCSWACQSVTPPKSLPICLLDI